MTKEEIPRAMREHAAMMNAAPIRSLAAERDALQAENARLRDALREIRNKARTGRPPFMSTKTDYFQIASAALGETQ